MNKKNPIFYNAILLTGVNLLLRFVSTGFQVYLSGRIGAEGIGLLQLVLSVGGLAMTLGMAGIRTSTMYLTAEEIGKGSPQNVKRVLSGCMRYSLVCSMTVAITLFIFSPIIAERWIGESSIADAVRLFAYFLPVNCLCGVMVGYFTAANRIRTLAVVEVLEQLLSMTTTVVLLYCWARHNSLKACASVVLGSGLGACLTLISLLFLQNQEGIKSDKRIPVGKRLLKTAVPLAIADDLKSGISTTENLMVPKRLALYPKIGDPLAAFGMVCGMVFPVLMFPAAILFGLAELLIPELARCSAAGSHQRIRYLAMRSLRLAMIYGTVFGGLLYLLGENLCIWLYDNQNAGIYLKWFALLAPMLYCDAVIDAMIKGLGQQVACVRYNILTSVMDVAMLFLLLPIYGIEGYFISFLISHAVNFLLSIRRLLKLTGKIMTIVTPLMTAFAAASAILLAGTLVSPAWRSLAYILILGCLLYLFRVISKEDLLWIKGMICKNKLMYD